MKKSALSVAATCLLASVALAVDPPLTCTRLLSGLNKPVLVQHAPGDFDRVFIVEQTGLIKIYKKSTNTLLATPFFNIATTVADSSQYLEYGLLGLVFDPGYATNGYFYIAYTPGNQNVADYEIVRYHVSTNPDVADQATGQRILYIDFGPKQHRSSWMEFGTDGYLYLTTGDGGENDPQDAASDTSAVTMTNQLGLRGKVLRIDVHGPDGLPGTADDDGFPADTFRNYHVPATNPWAGDATKAGEIWAYGLRNPWRASFDTLTGDIWIGDVGQNQREEVDILKAGSTVPVFYGWRCIEGTRPTGIAPCPTTLPPSQPPVFEYVHFGGSPSGLSVTGGFVYRGCAIPGVQGVYFYADWTGGRIWSFRYNRDTGVMSEFTDRQAELAVPGLSPTSGITSFGTDAYGEIYWTKGGIGSGEIWKLVPRTLQGADCNANGVTDGCEIAAGLVADTNHNGVPDLCEPCGAADVGHQGGVPGFDRLLDNNDFIVYIDMFFNGAAGADLGSQGGVPGTDGLFDNNDFVVFIDVFFTGCG